MAGTALIRRGDAAPRAGCLRLAETVEMELSRGTDSMPYARSKRKPGNCGWFRVPAAVAACLAAAWPSAYAAETPAHRVAIVVAEALYPSIETGLRQYQGLVAEGFAAQCRLLKIGPEATPRTVRERLRRCYEETAHPCAARF